MRFKTWLFLAVLYLCKETLGAWIILRWGWRGILVVMLLTAGGVYRARHIIVPVLRLALLLIVLEQPVRSRRTRQRFPLVVFPRAVVSNHRFAV